jgi:hypothetical protein
MGTFYGPKLVTGGLVLCADTGNIKSYPGSGNVWNDISYNNLNLTGNSAYVNAISGVVSGASWSTGTTAILNTDTHSIFFCVRFNSTATYPSGTTGGWEKIFTYAAGGSDRSPGIWRWPSNRWIHWRYDPGNSGCDFGVNSTTLDGNSEFPLNTWYYVGVTKNGGSTVMYVNGRQIGVGSVSNPKTSGNAAVTIYEYYTNPLSNLNSLTIYNRVITEAEVIQNYSALRGRYNLS